MRRPQVSFRRGSAGGAVSPPVAGSVAEEVPGAQRPAGSRPGAARCEGGRSLPPAPQRGRGPAQGESVNLSRPQGRLRSAGRQITASFPHPPFVCVRGPVPAVAPGDGALSCSGNTAKKGKSSGLFASLDYTNGHVGQGDPLVRPLGKIGFFTTGVR